MSHADPAAARAALLRREAVLAVVINAAISAAFYLLVFGWSPANRTMLAIDCLPQTFGISMLGGLGPSFLTLARVAKGKVIPAGPVPTRKAQARRVLLVAITAVPLFGGAMALAIVGLAPATLAPLPALIMKMIYGAVVGTIVTPPLIRLALGMPFWPGSRRT